MRERPAPSDTRFAIEALSAFVGTFAFMVCVVAIGGGKDPPIVVAGSALIAVVAAFLYVIA